ncbi:MAG: hypothetical protein KKA19_05480, partial [Candidatus Margulisbacteria bacterium]|nr:hypothetical protein [Candidatus Margulisiibacteriota bacterium]
MLTKIISVNKNKISSIEQKALQIFNNRNSGYNCAEVNAHNAFAELDKMILYCSKLNQLIILKEYVSHLVLTIWHRDNTPELEGNWRECFQNLFKDTSLPVSLKINILKDIFYYLFRSSHGGDYIIYPATKHHFGPKTV